MLQNRFFWGALIIVVLFVANIISYFASGWGLITVKVHGATLAKVIKSIEWQGGVTIYTNADRNAPISMDVERVPLAEAMETLAENVPPPDPAAGGAPGGGGAPPAGGRQGGGRGGFGGGGFGGAQWRLAFFAAPSSGQVKQEIHTFEAGGGDDDSKVFSYPTPLQMLATDSGMPAADPRLQVWSGLKPPPAPPSPPPAAPGDAQTGDANTDAPAPPSTVQDYLNVLAESADIWIMAPSTWDAKVSAAPNAGSSIASAVKTVVSRGHGTVEQALILVVRIPGQRPSGSGGGGRGFAGGDMGWAYMQDRMRNAINGLPPDAQADAITQLNSEADFRKSVMAAPPDQRRQMMRSHMMSHLGAMDNWRRSPETRAKMYSRVVANRQAAKGS